MLGAKKLRLGGYPQEGRAKYNSMGARKLFKYTINTCHCIRLAPLTRITKIFVLQI